eukprot:6179196-Pleurochrysis_carterae.AAC.1
MLGEKSASRMKSENKNFLSIAPCGDRAEVGAGLGRGAPLVAGAKDTRRRLTIGSAAENDQTLHTFGLKQVHATRTPRSQRRVKSGSEPQRTRNEIVRTIAKHAGSKRDRAVYIFSAKDD